MLRICELFAGVGGFRLGFESSGVKCRTVWFSQWEPNAKTQFAHECYVRHFGDQISLDGKYHTCEDIALVDKTTIPDHDLLCGGFPCQDYSVAVPLHNSKGLEGNKGKLWFQIEEVLNVKRPEFCLFENVERILSSPASSKGRDFSVILSGLQKFGYSVAWRVVDASNYGVAQRRKRIFILAARSLTGADLTNIFFEAFPVTDIGTHREFDISDALPLKFLNSGRMDNGHVVTFHLSPCAESVVPLSEIFDEVHREDLFLTHEEIEKFLKYKSSKKINRVSKTGHEYVYSEGKMSFPDRSDLPGRTILTGERSISRTSHVVADPRSGQLRWISPEECEKMQGFPPGWTSGMPDKKRYFCMGNALPVPLVERIAKALQNFLERRSHETTRKGLR